MTVFRRRFLRFSLRTMLVTLTLSAIPMGWVALKRQETRRQMLGEELLLRGGTSRLEASAEVAGTRS